MTDFKSVQDLIIKAAFYDKVSTTISADEMIGDFDVLKITFIKGDKCSTTRIDLTDTYRDPKRLLCFVVSVRSMTCFVPRMKRWYTRRRTNHENTQNYI